MNGIIITNGAAKEETATRAPNPPPNQGMIVADVDAMSDSEAAEDWRQRCGIDPSKQVRIVKLAHMRYQHPELETITTFLRDFGMHAVKSTDDQAWFRGYGPDQYVYYAKKGPKKFLGGTFEVETYADLERYFAPPFGVFAHVLTPT